MILGVGSVQADSTLDNNNIEVQQSITGFQTNNESVTDTTESTNKEPADSDNKMAVPIAPAAQSTNTPEQNVTETGQPNSFKTVNNKVYYYGNDGKQYKNQFYNNWGHTYYFGTDGVRYTNQTYTNWGQTYYFGGEGARYDNQWLTLNGKRYYFKQDGSRATSEFLGVNGNTYHFDNKGIATSWGKVYYDDPATKKESSYWLANN